MNKLKVFIGAVLLSLGVSQAEAQTNNIPGIPTVAALRLSNLRAAQYPGGVYLEGYYAAGDKGSGMMNVSSSTTCTDDGVLTFCDAANHPITRWNDGKINQFQGGAKCDSTGVVGNGTNDTTRILTTSQAANSSYRELVFLPTTPYYCRTNGRSVVIASNSVIRGAGKGLSRISYEDASTNVAAMDYSAGGTIANVTIEGITIRGSWDASPAVNANAACIYINNAYNVTIKDVECSNLHGGVGFKMFNVYSPTITNNYLHEISGNGITCEDCYGADISFNKLYHTADDCIAFQTAPTTTALYPGATIKGNYCQDTYGIKLLGGHGSVISGNTLLLPKIYCFYVGYAGSGASSEGYSSETAVVLSDNSCQDPINGSLAGGTALNIGIWAFSYGQAGSGTIPWRSNLTTVVEPWAYNWINGHTATTTPVATGAGMIISGNTIQRTLPAVATYSLFLFNPTNVTNGDRMFTAAGWVNPAVTAANLTGEGIRLQPYINRALITGNYLLGGGEGGTCLQMILTGMPNFSADNVIFKNNSCINFASAGIQMNLAAAQYVNMTIEGNFFDLDPFFQSANRLAGGTWANAAAPMAMDLSYAKGVTIGNNHVRNALIHVRTNGDTTYFQTAPDIMHLNPTAVGYNASNIGIGVVPVGQTYVIEDGVPTSATYGAILYAGGITTAGIPTTGKWVTGTLLPNTSAVCSGAVITSAYKRVTVGTGNVSGTDWIPITTAC